MKIFDKRAIAVAAALLVGAGAAGAQTSSGGITSQNAGKSGASQGATSGQGTTMDKGGAMATPASPNAAHSGMWDASLFARLDTNKDGMISRDEARADPMVRDSWDKLDAKHAGRVSRSDFDRFGQSRSNSGSGTGSTMGSTSGSTTAGASGSSTSGSTGSTSGGSTSSGTAKK